MQRCNLNIAIIDMIASTPLKLPLSAEAPNVTSECIENTEHAFFNKSIDTETNGTLKRQSFFSLERQLLNLLSVNILRIILCT